MGEDFTFEKFSEELVRQLKLTDMKIEYDLNVYDDLGIDSLSWVNTGIKLQEFYKIEIPTAEFIELLTVGEVFDYIKSKIK